MKRQITRSCEERYNFCQFLSYFTSRADVSLSLSRQTWTCWKNFVDDYLGARRMVSHNYYYTLVEGNFSIIREKKHCQGAVKLLTIHFFTTGGLKYLLPVFPLLFYQCSNASGISIFVWTVHLMYT